MESRQAAPEKSVTLLVGELLTLEEAQKFLPILLAALEEHERVILDLRGQNAIGFHGLQLLCAGHRSALNRHKKLALGNREEALLQMVHNAGYIRQESCLPGGQERCLWAGDPT